MIVDVTLENKKPQAVAISTLLQMSLKDNTGQQYKVDVMAATAGGGTDPGGELAPGETVRGQVGFEVPTGASGFVFVFDASIFGSGKVFVELPQ